MRTATYLTAFLLPITAALAQPTSIVFDGVLGNSGEKGDTLVRYESALPIGAGVAADRLGFFWATGGSGQVNRYAADGRLIGTYPAHSPTAEPKRLAATADKIVLLANDVISSLPINAAPGTPFQPLGDAKATLMSNTVWENQVAIWKAGDVSLVNLATGEVKRIATMGDAKSIELGPDGSIFTENRGEVFKVDPQGQPVAGWPRKLPASSGLIRVGDHFYTFWHSSSILRLTLELEPDPGVVLGGASGSVIARMPIDPDLRVTSGLAFLSPNVFAAAGYGGTVMLLYWNEKTNAFEVRRRIGGLPACRGLGISKDGWVVGNAGAWKPDSKSDSPLIYGSPLDPDGMMPAAISKAGMMVAPALRYNGRTWFFSNTFQRESDLVEVKENAFSKLATSAAMVNWEGRETLLVGEPDGMIRAYLVDGRGNLQKALGNLTLQTTQPIKLLNSLATGPDGKTLLAGIDGVIVELAPMAGGFEETARWSSWGADAAQSFGTRLYLAADQNTLWVSDTDKDRVLGFELPSKKWIATYSGGDYAVKTPQIISANNGRAVVYDSGNQRLLRLKLGSN